MSDQQLMEDVSEASMGYLDVYVRFNDDNEKDYCFQKKASDKFSSLFGIFEKLPIALRPSLFYENKPIGFRVSDSPGYLTEDGALLFDWAAHKFSRNVNNDDIISKHVWPGQLILPVWEFKWFRYYSFVSFLIVWLYTDLPDSISPTPGLCLSTQMINLAAKLLFFFNYNDAAAGLIQETSTPISHVTEAIFFTFHLVKVLALYFVLYSGLFNPHKMFAFKFAAGGNKLNITREELIEAGWTGSRKATPIEYKEYYRDYKIKEYGGMIKAHQAGLFDTLKDLGCFLKLNEGYSTPLDTKSTLKDLESGNLLSLNYEYISLLSSYFAEYIQGKEGKELLDLIKQYRRYGLLHSNEKIQAIVQKRKSLELKKDQ